jgi:hypothetical protein
MILMIAVIDLRMSSVSLKVVGAERPRSKTFTPLTFQYFAFTDP